MRPLVMRAEIGKDVGGSHDASSDRRAEEGGVLSRDGGARSRRKARGTTQKKAR